MAHLYMTPVTEKVEHTFLWLGPSVPSFLSSLRERSAGLSEVRKQVPNANLILKQLLHGKSACGHLKDKKQGNMMNHLCFARFFLADFQLVSRFPLYRARSNPRRPNNNHVPGKLLSGNETRLQSCEVTFGDRGPRGHQLQLI